MANRRALSDEAVQELLHEVTLDIEGDVTVMGAEEGSPTDHSATVPQTTVPQEYLPTALQNILFKLPVSGQQLLLMSVLNKIKQWQTNKTL